VGHAVLLAAALGVATTVGVYAAPGTVLSLYGVGAGSEMAAPAREYLFVRAASIPSIFLMYVAVGASLGAKNSVAPAAGVIAAAVVNLIGDGLLVLVLGLGLFGAAAATAAASWAGSAIVLGNLRHTVPWRLTRPRFADVAPLLAVSGALLCAQITNSVVYSYTTVTAASAGTVPAAAHQVALQARPPAAAGAPAAAGGRVR
jgi:Na+-driven multidrug efflux pump